MDTGAQVNCVDIKFCRRHNLQAIQESRSLDLPALINPDGSRLKNHGVYLISFILIDADNKTREVSQFFFGVQRGPNVPPLLWGNPGMAREGISLYTADHTFRFNSYSEILPAEFAADINQGAPTFIATISNISVGNEEEHIEAIDGPFPEPKDPLTLPPEIAHRAAVFSEEAAKQPPTLEGAEHCIDLIEGAEPPQRPIYPLSQRQLGELAAYIKENLANGRIIESGSPAGAPILFVPKKDGTMRLCVDYRGLNKITIKNRYPLPLISELIDRMIGARYFTKLDLRDAYHRIRIRKEDRWKTAFKTRYGQFEYTVMPFGLTNAPATFQAYINRALAGLVDVFCVVYLDDILIYSRTREEHTQHILQVLDRLEQFQLFAKPSKCSFYQERVEFLGFIIDQEGITMDPKRVESIQSWPAPESTHDIQVFLGFANFYRRFIEGYSRITTPITALLQGCGAGPFQWTTAAAEAFDILKKAFASAKVLRYWNPDRPTRVETDASNKAISGILSQLVDSQWHPAAFWSRKLTDTELRWATGQKELLAIVESLEHWSHYLEGIDKKFIVLTDHQALKGVITAPPRDLRGRLARWVYRLSGFDFDLEHRPGKTNPADPLSRRPDYMDGEITYEDVLPTLTKKLQLPADLPPTTLAMMAQLRAGEKRHNVSRKYRRMVRRQCQHPRVGHGARVSAVTRSALQVSTHEKVSEDGTGLDTGLVAARPRRSQESRTWPGRSSNKVEEQSQQGARCADLLIPHAVAAEVCAGEAVGVDYPGRRFYDSIGALQKGDVECCALVSAVMKSRENQADSLSRKGTKGYDVDDNGILRFKERLVIPAAPAVRRELVRLHHNDPRAGHFGGHKTTELLKRRFHWENLDLDVKTYVNHCQVCLGNRQPRHKPYGELSSLPLPTQPFEEISLDFITKLPLCQFQDRIMDAILVIVDRFTKIALFIPTTTTITAAELAQLLYENVECRFGTPLGIVSDRDSLLTSQFWAELCKARQVKRRLSTAYHPQTDGQTERTHQTLQHYLRSYCTDDQQWTALLKEAEFAYNNSVHSTIGVSPFEALYGYHPRMVDYIPSSTLKVQGVHERLSVLGKIRERMYIYWQKAVDAQKKYYDARHQWIEFQVEEVVGLSTKNFRFKNGRKLAPTFIPVRIKERIGRQAYRVQLPRKYDRLHDVFPVSLLEKWGVTGEQKVLPLPDLVDNEEEWEVEQILEHKDFAGEIRYLVKWAGWPVEYNTWEPKGNLDHAQEMLRAYDRRAKQRHRKWDD